MWMPGWSTHSLVSEYWVIGVLNNLQGHIYLPCGEGLFILLCRSYAYVIVFLGSFTDLRSLMKPSHTTDDFHQVSQHSLIWFNSSWHRWSSKFFLSRHRCNWQAYLRHGSVFFELIFFQTCGIIFAFQWFIHCWRDDWMLLSSVLEQECRFKSSMLTFPDNQQFIRINPR